MNINRIFRSLLPLAATFAVLASPMVVALPAEARSSTTALTQQVNDDAFFDQFYSCYGYRVSGTGSDPFYLNNVVQPAFHTDAFQAYYRARCNPFSPSAKVLSRKNAVNLAAYRRGLRTGYCFRLLGRSKQGSQVPVSCVMTVERVSTGNFYLTQT